MNRRRWIAAGTVLASIAVGASSCTESVAPGASCGEGSGHWIQDESNALKGGYTVVVSICVDRAGNVIDIEVD